MRRILSLVMLSLSLALVLTACAKAEPTPTPGATPTRAAPTPGVTPAPAAITAPVPGATANFRMLISDERNAIGDFQSLVVTISRIGVLQAVAPPSPTPEPTSTPSSTPTPTPTPTPTSTPEPTVTPSPTATPTSTPSPTPTPSSEGRERWFEFVPEVAQVDLVLLQGKNAQEVWGGNIPPGRYLKVFIYVDSVVGTLQNGQVVSVKLPSGKLQISKPFEIAPGVPVDFVLDFTVIKVGREGKADFQYILLPQVGESGHDQPFTEVRVKGALKISLDGEAQPGKTITITVTDPQGKPVAGARVKINDREVGTTNDKGQLVYTIPATATEIEIEVRADKLKGKLEIEFHKTKGRLLIGVEGEVQPGKIIIITVTDRQGQPVAGAAVTLNDAPVGTTDPQGRLSLTIPPRPVGEEVEIEARWGELKGEWELDLKRPRGKLHLTLDGEAVPGATVALIVTYQGQPVAGATVTLNDAPVGTTDPQGTLSLTIPQAAEEVEIEARWQDREGELEIKLVEERERQPQRHFRGTIAAITQGTPNNSPWTVSIPGVGEAVTVVLSEAEEIEIEGTLQVGATAEIEGVLEDGVIYAREAEVEGKRGKPEDKGKPEEPRKTPTPGRP